MSTPTFQNNIALVTATSLTPPPQANFAVIAVKGGPINWTNDGTTPTTVVGIPAAAGERIVYTGPLDLFKAIQTDTNNPATISIAYFYEPRFMGGVRV